MIRTFFSLTVCAVLLAVPTYALYNRTDVVELTATNFDKLVLQSNDIWIVQFYVPWCRYCKELKSEYSKAAKTLKGIAKVGAVNAVDHKPLCRQYNVRMFPTIKIFGVNKREPTDFTGNRTAQAITEAALAAAKSKKSVKGRKGRSSNKGSGDS